MTYVQIDDYYCPFCERKGYASLNMNTGVYTCLMCNKNSNQSNNQNNNEDINKYDNDKNKSKQEVKMKEMTLKEQLKMLNEGWEPITKGKWISRKMPESSASIRKKCMNVSEDLRGFFEGSYGTEIYLNKKENLMGLKPSNDEFKAFRLKAADKGGIISTNVERWTKNYGIFKAEWDAESEMVVIDMNRPLTM